MTDTTDIEPVSWQVTISKQELADLPLADYNLESRVVSTEEDLINALDRLRKAPCVGFDTETRPSFKKGQIHKVSLLQLSTDTTCFLVRLNKLGLHSAIVDFLEDSDILKVGVSLKDDFMSLRRLGALEPRGFIDLQQYVKQFRIADNSLARIYAIIFDQRISKGQRLSNWEAEDLSPAQVKYAAFDAIACVRIHGFLTENGFSPEESKYYKPIETE